MKKVLQSSQFNAAEHFSAPVSREAETGTTEVVPVGLSRKNYLLLRD